jgi:hypothetical protein
LTFTSSGGTGAIFSGLPSGVSGSYNSVDGEITLSGTPSVAGTFNYSINLVGCTGGGNASAIGTLIVTSFNTLAFVSAPSSANQVFCSGTAMDSVRIRITGTTTFTASGLPAGVTAIRRNDTIILGGTPLSGSPNLPLANDTLFAYTIELTGGCTGGTNSISGSLRVRNNGSISLQAGSNNTQTVCIGSAISNIIYKTGRANQVIFSGLPSGVNGAFDSINRLVTLSGTPTIRGTYAYSVLVNGGCIGNPNVATGTITVQGYTVALRPISAPSSQTVCLGGTIQAISYATTGATGIGTATGLPTGLTASWAANVLTVSGTVAASVAPGTFNFSVPMDGLTGCPGVNATGSIVVTGNRTVGAASSTPTLCISSALPANITHATTIATGIGIPTGLPAGCTAVFSGNATSGTVTISGTPTAIGVYNYTIPMVGCGTANATGTITVQGYTVALRPISAPSSQTVCLGGTIQAISYATAGATGIGTATGLPTGLTATWAANVLTVSGTVAASVTPGTFNFSVPLSGLPSCPSVNATGSIVVRAYNSITSTTGTPSPTVCLGDGIGASGVTPSIVYTTTGFTNGVNVSGLPSGVGYVYDQATQTTTISGTPSVRGVFVYRITALGGCTQNSSNTLTGTITVRGNAIFLGKKDANLSTPDLLTNTQTRCVLRPIQPIVFTTTGATGASLDPALPSNSGLSLNFNSGTGVITVSGTPRFSFTYTGQVLMSGGCTSGQIEPTINITVLDSNKITLTSATGSDSQTKPRNTAIDDITYATLGASGARFRGLPSGVTGIWAANTVTISGTPVSTGTYQYIIDLVGGCSVGKGNSDTGTITVTSGGSLIGGGNGEQGFEGDYANRSNQNNTAAMSSGRLISNRGLITTMSVYPVPGSEFLYVRGLASLEQASLSILDQTGRVVLAPHTTVSKDASTGEFKLDLSPLANGVYFLRVQSAIEGIDQMLRFSVKH